MQANRESGGQRPPPAAGQLSASGQAAAAPAGEAALSDIIALLWQRRFSVAAPVALAGALALAYVLTAPKLYSGTTALLVDPRYGRGYGVENLLNPLAGDLTLIESQVKIINSQNVLRRVVREQKLTSDGEFSPAPSGLMALLGLAGESKKPADIETAAMIELAKYVTVKRAERTYVIEVSASSADAAKSARLAEAIAQAYIVDQIEAKSEAARRETDWIRVKLQELQARLQEAETKVEVYKERNKIYGASGKLVNEQQLAEATNELTQARTKTSEFKAKHDQVQIILRAGREPESIAEALKSAGVDKLRAQMADIAREEANLRATLGPRHPRLLEVQQQRADTRRLITDELRRVGEAARTEYNAARGAEQQLEAQLDLLKRGSAVTGQSLVALRELDREVDMHRAAFDKFSKAQDLVQQQSAEIPVARIIASAVIPVAPASPRRIPIMALSLAGGLGIGIALALLGGRKDAPGGTAPRLARPFLAAARNEPAASNRLIAGVLPLLAPEPGSKPRLFSRFGKPAAGSTAVGPLDPEHARLFETARHPNSEFARAAHDIYLVAAAARPASLPYSLLITSARPGAGKTTVAANLARAAIRAGELVLLVDGNQNNPTLTAVAGQQGQTVTVGNGQRSRATLALDDGAAGLIAVSPQWTDPAAGSLGPLDWTSGGFTFIVVDGGAMASPGTLSMAHAVDQVLVIGGADDDMAALHASALADLLIGPGRLIGVVAVMRGKAADAGQRSAA